MSNFSKSDSMNEKMRYTQNISVELIPSVKSNTTLVEDKIREQEREKNDDAFFICDLGGIIDKYDKWMSLLPRVKPFYALKCCNDVAVSKLLADLGTSFDCASKAEIEDILSIGISASRIVYSHPCKQTSYIKYAANNGIFRMTFDNEEELHKVKVLCPNAELLIRILPSESFKAKFSMGKKFGCTIRKTRHLLETAKLLELNVIGVSFHVGSGCLQAEAYAVAIKDARDVFDIGEDLGFVMTILDIGGGFPGHINDQISFEEIVAVINNSLDKYFPQSSNIEVIAEPGRYFVASAFTLVVNIIGKRTEVEEQDMKDNLVDNALGSSRRSIMYYVNAGVHGVFNVVCFDKNAVNKPIVIQDEISSTLYKTCIWGPACSAEDCILQKVELPDLRIGSWLYFENMGAYTLTLSSLFNGMPMPRVLYVCRENIWKKYYPNSSHNGLHDKTPPI